MWSTIKTLSLAKKVILSFLSIVIAVLGVSSIVYAIGSPNNTEPPIPICNGKQITENCQDENGTKYSKYVYHEAVTEVTKTINHPYEPAKTHTVHHEAVYGTKQIRECVKTSISYKSGSCALSQCRDGSFSGSAGRGTCSSHGGVARSGGPWYTYRTETYVITPAWDETVVDVPAKEAWTETIVVTPAKPAYYEIIEAFER